VANRKRNKRQRAEAAAVPERDYALVLAILAGVVLAFTLALRWHLRNTPLERDEGEYAYLGQLILDGIPPYLTAYSTKFPGMYIVAAMAMKVLGQSPAALRGALAATNLLSTVFLFLIIRKVIDRQTAWISAASFLALSMTTSVLGMFAHATNFVTTGVLAGVWCLLIDDTPAKRRGFTFLSGVMFGVAVLFKQHAALFLLFALFLIGTRRIREKKEILQAVFDAILLGAGVVLPVLVMMAWVRSAHAFDKFWWWTIDYASKYVSELPMDIGLSNLRAVLTQFAEEVPLLTVLFFAGIILTLFAPRFRKARLFVIVFLVVSFIATVPGHYFRGHYFAMVMPVSAILIAITVRWLTTVRSFIYVAVAIFLLGLAGPLFHNSDFYFRFTPRQVSRFIYGLAPFPEAVEIARFVASRTKPDDRVAILGSEPEIYFYAHRHGSTGYIWTYPLTEPQPYASQMQREMMREVETSHPKIAIVLTSGNSWTESAPTDFTIFKWTETYFPAHYRLIGFADTISETETVYRWDADAASYRPKSRDLILVWERI
jgi:hypothetical protein